MMGHMWGDCPDEDLDAERIKRVPEGERLSREGRLEGQRRNTTDSCRVGPMCGARREDYWSTHLYRGDEGRR